MRWLPAISIGRARLRLPLGDRTAGRLVDILLQPTLHERAADCARLLADDPAFVVWALGQLATDERAEAAELASLASLLAGRLVRRLAPLLREPNDELSTSDAERAATIASSIAPSGVEVPFAFVRLAVSLDAWVNFAAERGETKGPSRRQIDLWLPKACRRPDVSSEDPAAEADDAASRQETARRDWLQRDSAAQVRLVALLRRLVRLRRLERRFAATLEEEKLAALGELAYGASHEINNPLANISARAQTLLRDEEDPERRRKLAAIKTQAERAHEMIADLMLFARPPRLVPTPVDLCEFAIALASELGPMAAARETTICCQATSGKIAIEADPVQLAVAVRALVQNSLEALGRGGTVSLEVGWAEKASGGRKFATIIVADSGPGIRPEVRRHLFDPFYSGREAGRGLGFGLSKCWRIVGDHGGRIDVECPPTGGAVFRLLLPRVAFRT